MKEELRKVAERIVDDEIAMSAYKHFLESTARKRYFGYVDKDELKRLCKEFNYTDTRSFIKGGIAAAIVIWLFKEYRNYQEYKNLDLSKEYTEEVNDDSNKGGKQ